MMKLFIAIITSIIWNIYGTSAQDVKLLVKTDAQGNVIEGSLDTLISAVRDGNDIKVGWSLDFNNDNFPDVEHFIDAKFLTILNGHVFNQIDPIYAQAPNAKIPQVEIANNNMKWIAIIGTNGVLMSRFIIPEVDDVTDENYKKQLEIMSQVRKEVVKTSWFVKK